MNYSAVIAELDEEAEFRSWWDLQGARLTMQAEAPRDYARAAWMAAKNRCSRCTCGRPGECICPSE